MKQPQSEEPQQQNKINKRTYFYLYLFLIELILSIYYKSWILFWITLFEHANDIFLLKDPVNYSMHIQEFISKFLLFFYNFIENRKNFPNYTTWKVSSWIRHYILTGIKDVIEALNTFIVQMEASGYFTEKGGWISFYHTIMMMNYIVFLFY